MGIHFVKAEVTMSEFPGFPEMTVEDSMTKFGLDLGGGISTPVAPRADLMGELWYGIVSDVNQFNLRFGMCYQLGS